MDNQISLGTAAPAEEPLISLGEDPKASLPPTPEVAANRANKASIGLPNTTMSNSDIYRTIVSGDEDKYRQHAAGDLDTQQAIKRSQLINQIAGKQGRPLSPIEAEFIQRIAKHKQANPNGVIEDGFAQATLDNIIKTAKDNPDSFLNQALQEDPDSTSKALSEAKGLAYKKEKAQTWFENAENSYNNQSWLGWGADQAKYLSGLYEQVKLRGLSGDTSMWHGALGTNLAEQARDLFMRSDDEFTNKGQAIYDKLVKDNPSAALTFFSALRGQTKSEETLRNILPTINLMTGVEGIAVGKLMSKFFGTAVKQAAVATIDGSRVAIDEATGNTREAGINQFAENLYKKFKGTADPKTEAMNAMQSVFNIGISDLQRDVRFLSQEHVNRLTEQAAAHRNALMTQLTESLNVNRLPDIFSIEENVRALSERERALYSGIENTIFDTAYSYDKVSGLNYLVSKFNKNGTDLFGKITEANAFVKNNNLKSAGKVSVEQQGGGFYVTITKPFNEKDPFVQNILLTTDFTKTPNSMLNAMALGKTSFGALRTPEDTLSAAQNVNRKVATVGPNNYFENVIKPNSEAISQLQKRAIPGTTGLQKWNEWKRVMGVALKDFNHGTGSIPWEDPQAFFRTPGELIDLFERVAGRLPDEQEIAASFAYKRNIETLDILNRRREAIRQGRQGAMTYTLNVPVKETEKALYPQKLDVNAFPIREFPTSNDSMLILGDRPNSHILTSALNFKSKLAESLKQQFTEGKIKILQIVNPEDKPLGRLNTANSPGLTALPNSHVKYIVVRSSEDIKLSEAKALDWSKVKVGRIPEHDYDFYVGQANLHEDPITGLFHYLGDRTIMGHNIRALTTDVASKLDNIRKLMKAVDMGVAQNFHSTSGLPQSWSEIKDWFDRGHLNLEEPIRVVPNGKRIVDLDREMQDRIGSKFVDSHIESKGPDPYDIFTVDNKGTKHNPLYSISPAKYIDPMTSMNRALTRAVNSTFMDDYKMFAVEHWLQEAKDHLTVSADAIQANPNYHFYNPQWKQATDLERVNNLKTVNLQIRQFLGIKSESDQWLHRFAQNAADFIYGINAQSTLVPKAALPFIRDPFAFIRSIVFNEKLGLFNPAQVFVQLNQFTNMLGIAGPINASKGAAATMLHTWGRVNGTDEIVNHLDRLASNMGWKAGEFAEARKLFQSTGFEFVGRENVFRDSTMYNDFVGNRWQRFLNAGQVFFRESERLNRTTAWYTAFKEFRDLHPTGAISDADAGKILQRADLLTTNMTRASASAIHQGIGSIPTTFMSYYLRLAEQVWGKRLTGLERGRLFGTYALLYGVPAAWGISGLPIGELLNKWSTENGYAEGTGEYVSDFLRNGLPEFILNQTTGNTYNISQRYGQPGGLQPLSDLLHGDKGIWDILGGAPYSIMSQSIAGTYGFFRFMLDGLTGQGSFPSPDDYVEPWLQISSVSSTWKLLGAINYGRVYSNKERFLTETTVPNAIAMYLTGLSPGEEQAAFERSWIMKDEKALQLYGEKQFIKEMQRAFIAANEKDEDASKKYRNHAFRWLEISGYPREDYGKAISMATDTYRSMVSKIDWDFAFKHVPPGRKPIARDQFKREIERNK